MKGINSLDIVAPAGDIEKFYAAIDAGADEVYMGLQGFGARKSAKNFTMTEYKAAIDYAHERGSKVLLTLNTVMMDGEIEALYHNLNELYKTGLDAIIVQDIGMFNYLKNNFPKIEIHGSTQMTVSNHIEAEYLREIGFNRVVLARELTLENVREIRKNTTIGLEVFVSGSLCVSYSGNCYMSSFIGGRSGNRGMCAQPCRKTYTINGKEEGYVLSPKDQLMGKKEIDYLREIGINSIKIEGRMKEASYVFELTSYYKALIEGKNSEERVSHIFNRGYSKGYAYDEQENIINKNFSFNIGKKLGTFNGKEIKLIENVRFGDGVSYLSKEYEKLGGSYLSKLVIKTYDKNREKSRASSEEKDRVGIVGETLIIKDIPVGTRYLYKTYDKNIEDKIENEKKQIEKKILISGVFKASLNKYPELRFYYSNLYGKEVEFTIIGEKLVELAGKKAVTSEQISEKLNELGGSSFILEKIKIEIEDNLFIPMSIIKRMRRDCVEELTDIIVDSYKRKEEPGGKWNLEENNLRSHYNVEKKEIIVSAIVETEEQKQKLIELGINKIYYTGTKIVREDRIKNIIYQGDLANNLMDIIKNPSEKLTLHWGLNVTNSYTLDKFSKNKKIDTVILSPELSFEKIKKLRETSIKKALLIYSKPKIMHIEASVVKKNSIIINDKGDEFKVEINSFGNSEVYLTRALNITQNMKEIRTLNIDEVVLEFKNETLEEIEKIVVEIKERKDEGRESSGYNYWKGVF
ncbi:MAG: DUF3656 domain-containing U32 family peptidase [Fusobacteriaceae bacterium]